MAANEPRTDRPAAPSTTAARDKAAAADKPGRRGDAKADRTTSADADRANRGGKQADASGRRGKQADADADRETRGAKGGRDAKDTRETKDGKGGKPDRGSARKADDKADAPGGERFWVQVASGSNRADLGKVWGKTREKAPKLLNGRTTWTTPWNRSNRLLVGPFKSEEEAQGLVNSLGKAGLGGIPFTTRGKTKVEKLSAE